MPWVMQATVALRARAAFQLVWSQAPSLGIWQHDSDAIFCTHARTGRQQRRERCKFIHNITRSPGWDVKSLAWKARPEFIFT